MVMVSKMSNGFSTIEEKGACDLGCPMGNLCLESWGNLGEIVFSRALSGKTPGETARIGDN